MNESVFFSLWKPLLGYALNRGIDHDTAQDLAVETIYKVIDQFNPERGDILHFAYRILGNMIKNHYRGQSRSTELVDEHEDNTPSPYDYAELKEQEEYAINTLLSLKTQLSVKELELLNILQSQMENSGKINISEAARTIGIEPLKAHDIHRKIQRKLIKITDISADKEFYIAEPSGVRETSDLSYSASMSFDDQNSLTEFLVALNVFERISKYLNKPKP